LTGWISNVEQLTLTTLYTSSVRCVCMQGVNYDYRCLVLGTECLLVAGARQMYSHRASPAVVAGKINLVRVL